MKKNIAKKYLNWYNKKREERLKIFYKNMFFSQSSDSEGKKGKIKMRKTEENEKAEIRNMQNEKIEKQSKNNENPETLAAVHTHVKR